MLKLQAFNGLYFFLTSVTFAQSDCELRKDQEGIKIYACKSLESDIKSIKAEFTIDGTLNEFATVILDIKNYTHWQYKTVKANIVKKISDNELVYYTEVAAPCPLTNRDVTVHLTMTRDPKAKKIIVSTKSVDGYLPEKENTVRVPMSRATWIVSEESESKLKVNYALQVEPGGSISPWMINMVSDEAPFQSFVDLRKRISSK